MMKSANPIYIGHHAIPSFSPVVSGDIVTITDEPFYKISNYDQMPPFFMNIASNSDLWMFISSNGALTAGRRNANNALFPYYTDDRIHDSQEITGSRTILFVHKDEKAFLWQPFSDDYQGLYQIERNIYKNMLGNQVIFEEVNHDLKIAFQYAWLNCNRFGWIRRTRIKNANPEQIEIRILDGIQNILPAGVDRILQLEFSTLVDGYKKNELLADSSVAVYTLSSLPTDRAEPNEALRATAVWSTGLDDAVVLLSTAQLDAFRKGRDVEQETDMHGKRGAYFLTATLKMDADAENEWYIVTDVNQDQSDIVGLSRYLNENQNVKQQLAEEISQSSNRLKRRIADADGNQLTGDTLNDFRHASNTLFNIMRGGVFDDGYSIKRDDFQLFVEEANVLLAEKYSDFLNNLPDQLHFHELIERASETEPAFEKLCYEYLPITFSRRHGDPSRPWNHFSIEIVDEDGNKKLNYQGNWRDIFQNWEALALSFPEYIENMLTKFVNACTADGYNPYRVTRDGFDWEVPSPDEAWANIGYWGDHQIIYLLKLLELSVKYHPGKLHDLLAKEIFAYANVPYKIKSYQDILRNPHDTINFDFDLNDEIEDRVKALGTDGKFIQDKNGRIYHVNLAEKLLVLILVKFSNFVPEAGIWMNTQRPEWNDANNALVGYGTSMVTAYYLRRFLVFSIDLFKQLAEKEVTVSEHVFELFSTIKNTLEQFKGVLADYISDQNRKKILDQLGQAGSDHREKSYEHGVWGERRSLAMSDLVSFMETGLEYLNHTIRANKRPDNLYHSYNLINISGTDEVSIRHMYEMLEGQVAVLSSGYLSDADAMALIGAVRESALYREDQASYMLYPDRTLSRFMDKNTIPAELLLQSELLNDFIKRGDKTVVIQDENGNVHFHSNFRNGTLLKKALEELKADNSEMSEPELNKILNIYETVFDHQSFTGRSGTFYKYEGLGSIYWHMVSKYLLAVQEIFTQSVTCDANQAFLNKLKAQYYEIKAGIGSHKSPEHYGAFPTDAYSHTPKGSGVQQPGMTGQVKEDFITRFGELGVHIENGKIKFDTALMQDEAEFITEPQEFTYYDVNGDKQTLPLNSGMLAFTICQVPVVYKKSKASRLVVFTTDGNEKEIDGLELSLSESRCIFQRDGRIRNVQVMVGK